MARVGRPAAWSSALIASTVLEHEQPVAAEKGVGAGVTMADVGVLASKDEHVDPELASQRMESGTICGCAMTPSACTGA